MLRFDRKQQNSVKQLSFNKKQIKKKNISSVSFEDSMTNIYFVAEFFKTERLLLHLPN